MIRLEALSLPAGILADLAKLQQEVDAKSTYEQKVAEGKRLFSLKSRSKEFRPIRDALGQMCAGVRRCCYCEDSQATDIDHIWPKDFYPELVFDWENYLYGCARCNRPKSNQCDIYSHPHGRRITVASFVRQHGRHPPEGDALLINPRLEDPLDFIMLDLNGTFFFLPTAPPDTQSRERAEYTIRLLKLNEEDVLPIAREEAYENYVARLEKYVNRKSRGAQPEILQRLRHSVMRMGHPTVWHEMKRQAQSGFHGSPSANIQHLKDLFLAVPEAIDW